MGTTTDRTFNLKGKSYDNMLITEHVILAHDFGNAGLSLQYGRPSGARFCKIVDVVIDNVSEVFTADGRIHIGTAADPDKFLLYVIPEVAVGGSATLSDDADAISASANGTNLIDMEVENIQELECDFVDSGATGIADTKVILGWWG